MSPTIPPFSTLADWLAWQETQHPRAIDLGLERVRTVLDRLHPAPFPFRTITVGGTNGKGSAVALLESILCAAGYTVGVYTSPHLLRYNERIRINGDCAPDSDLIDSFSRIAEAQGTTSLTYFEYGTLAALDIFNARRVDVALLEVGLGGRLDAVNVVDADAALVVSIGIDHTDWLGPNRDSIGYEKAGIYRPGRPAICADTDPPATLCAHAHTIGAQFLCAGQDYHVTRTATNWSWTASTAHYSDLPLPALAGAHQVHNAAGVLATLHSLRAQLPISTAAFHHGLQHVRLPGRFQQMLGPVEWIIDVAHNPAAATVLAEQLRTLPCQGQTHAIFGALADKDAAGIFDTCVAVIDHWHLVTLTGARGRTATQLATILHTVAPYAHLQGIFSDMTMACNAVQYATQRGDRVVIFGSFHVVAPALTLIPSTSIVV